MGNVVGNWDQRKYVLNDENYGGICEESAVMPDGEISKYVDILQGIYRHVCTLSTILVKVYINDMIAIEAAKEGVTVGEDEVSRLMFADDFLGISETPKELQEHTEKALECASKWRVTANVKKCAVVVQYNEDKVNPVTFRWKWGVDEFPIVDRYTYVGVEVSKECSWDAHIAKVTGKGISHAGKMDAILTDSHLDTKL